MLRLGNKFDTIFHGQSSGNFLVINSLKIYHVPKSLCHPTKKYVIGNQWVHGTYDRIEN